MCLQVKNFAQCLFSVFEAGTFTLTLLDQTGLISKQLSIWNMNEALIIKCLNILNIYSFDNLSWYLYGQERNKYLQYPYQKGSIMYDNDTKQTRQYPFSSSKFCSGTGKHERNVIT